MNRSPGLDVELIPGGREKVPRHGPVGSVHDALLLVAPEDAGRLLTTGFLRGVGHAYWRFLSRISLGLLRVRAAPGHRSLVLLFPRPVLLRFGEPRYHGGADWAEVGWAIDRGLLVAREGRGRGSLRFRIQRGPLGDRDADRDRLLMRMEVDGYYPRFRGGGWFAPAGAWLYARTQARVHRRVMRGFLRSLAGLELSPESGCRSAPAWGVNS